MKKSLNLNKDFLHEYFINSSYVTTLYGSLSDQQRIALWKMMINIIEEKILDHKNKESHISIQSAKIFCKKYKINKSCIGDIAWMHHHFHQSTFFQNGYDQLKEMHPEFVRMHNLLRQIQNKSIIIERINFYQKNGKPFSIKNIQAVEMLLDAITGGYKIEQVEAIFAGQTNNKKTFTHDLKVFSWALLNYFNLFTQYKAPSDVIATNEQCRMINEMLKDAGLLQEREGGNTEEANYIRGYLKQAKAIFSEPVK